MILGLAGGAIWQMEGFALFFFDMPGLGSTLFGAYFVTMVCFYWLLAFDEHMHYTIGGGFSLEPFVHNKEERRRGACRRERENYIGIRGGGQLYMEPKTDRLRSNTNTLRTTTLVQMHVHVDVAHGLLCVCVPCSTESHSDQEHGRR